MFHVAIVDHTKKHKPPSGVLAEIVRSINLQLTNDFGPAWAISAKVSLASSGEQVHLFDDADQAGALGWHDVDKNGRPYAHVFAGPSIEQGASDWLSGPYAISATISHEILEMLGDPVANDFAFDDRSTLWAREACDAVEADSYDISGVPVSNFVLPAYFNPFAPGPYDHLGNLTKPLSIGQGGYAIVARLSGETQRFGLEFDDQVPAWRRAQKQHSASRSSWILATHAAEPG